MASAHHKHERHIKKGLSRGFENLDAERTTYRGDRWRFLLYEQLYDWADKLWPQAGAFYSSASLWP